MNRVLRAVKNLHRCAGRATVCRAAHGQSSAPPPRSQQDEFVSGHPWPHCQRLFRLLAARPISGAAASAGISGRCSHPDSNQLCCRGSMALVRSQIPDHPACTLVATGIGLCAQRQIPRDSIPFQILAATSPRRRHQSDPAAGRWPVEPNRAGRD